MQEFFLKDSIMANHKSAKKRIRQTKKRTARNRAATSATRTALKKVRIALSENKKEEALKLFPEAQGLLARLAGKGVIKKNNAARKTARLAGQIANLKSPEVT